MSHVLTAREVADYFLVLVNREEGDLITQLKLQKLVYFAQGISLALRGKPLFNEEIEAYKRGPVVRALRAAFGSYENNPIPSPGEMDFRVYNDQEKALIYNVYNQYGQYSVEKLANETHKHSIWQAAFNNQDDHVMHKKTIKDFFANMHYSPDFLLATPEGDVRREEAEDEWWMNYESPIPSEIITISNI